MLLLHSNSCTTSNTLSYHHTFVSCLCRCYSSLKELGSLLCFLFIQQCGCYLHIISYACHLYGCIHIMYVFLCFFFIMWGWVIYQVGLSDCGEGMSLVRTLVCFNSFDCLYISLLYPHIFIKSCFTLCGGWAWVWNVQLISLLAFSPFVVLYSLYVSRAISCNRFR